MASGLVTRPGRVLAAAAGAQATDSPEVLREFLYEAASFPQCHASSVVETQHGLLATWFGGSGEGHSDVCIYTARRTAQGWSQPERVAEGRMDGDDRRYPCWNPVLFQPRGEPLLLFYKVGPKPSSWWGMLKTSTDNGRNWSAPRRLPAHQLGPVRAKPIELPDGTLVCGSSTEDAGWQVQIESSQSPYRRWARTPALNLSTEWGAIQPTLLQHGRGELQILCRSRQRAILESWSTNDGISWSPLARTSLPNPNSGIDSVRLDDGRFLLVYNHAEQGRTRLNLALSTDGRKWMAAHVIEDEPGEFSYPAAILARDHLVHITYTWNRRKIRHVAVDPDRLHGRPMEDGRWPE